MKHVTIVAPMESNGRYCGGIMSIANTLYDHRETFEKYGIILGKFNTYILKRKAESNGRLDFTNIRNMFCIFSGLMRETKGQACDTLYYNTSTKAALLKDLLVIRMLRLFGRKQRIVAHIHFAEIDKILPGQPRLRRYMLRVLNRYVDRVVFLSEQTKLEFEHAGLQAGKGCVIYNFYSGQISRENFARKKELLKEKKPLDFLFMGSIDSRKGILDLMHAFASVDPEEARLHICGSCNDDQVREEFESLLDQMKDRVVFHGFVTGAERDRIMDQADCMVLPSYGEGFPLVLLDGMAHGSACITTPVGAVPEFFRDPENGFIFQAGDVPKLETAIVQMLSDRNRMQQQMDENFRLSDDFSLEKFIEKLAQVV